VFVEDVVALTKAQQSQLEELLEARDADTDVPAIGAAPPVRRWFNSRQAADYLSATKWFVEQSVRDGLLAARTAGKTYIFDRQDLDVFAESLRVTNSERATRATKAKAA
jgi:excisionase family DNA binding protein